MSEKKEEEYRSNTNLELRLLDQGWIPDIPSIDEEKMLELIQSKPEERTGSMILFDGNTSAITNYNGMGHSTVKDTAVAIVRDQNGIGVYSPNLQLSDDQCNSNYISVKEDIIITPLEKFSDSVLKIDVINPSTDETVRLTVNKKESINISSRI